MTTLLHVLFAITALSSVYCLVLFGLDWLLTNRQRIGGSVLAILGIGIAAGVALVRIGLAYIVVRQRLRQLGRSQ